MEGGVATFTGSDGEPSNSNDFDGGNPPVVENPPINHDHDTEMLRKKRRAKWECIIVVGIAVIIVIIVIVTVSVLAVKNKNAKADYATTPSPTPSPSVLIADPQVQLDYLREQIGANNITSDYLNIIPADVASLAGKHENPQENPVTRAASWLVEADGLNRESNLVRRFALAAIFYTNGGANWTNSTNWMSDTQHHCTWYGVTCCGGFLDQVAPSCTNGTDPGEIVSITLSNNNLTGNITEIYSLFRDLQALDLGYNSLVGQLPALALGSLPQFMSLSVQHNQLSGLIPQELRKNGVLHTLFVQRNNFTGTWPNGFCYPTIDKFGLDCDEVTCRDESCCDPDVFCYYDGIVPVV